jgi:hypothetical protein
MWVSLDYRLLALPAVGAGCRLSWCVYSLIQRCVWAFSPPLRND